MTHHGLCGAFPIAPLECRQNTLMLFERQRKPARRSEKPPHPLERHPGGLDRRLDPREIERIEQDFVELEIELVEAVWILRLDRCFLVAHVALEGEERVLRNRRRERADGCGFERAPEKHVFM